MKHYKYITILTTLLFASCQNEQVETPIATKPIQFAVAMQQPDVTRAGVNVQNTMFDSNEQIDVFIKDKGNTIAYAQPIVYKATPVRDEGVFYALTDPRTTANAVLSPGQIAWPNTTNIDINAFYPKGIVLNLTTAHSFTIQTDQSTDAKYRQSDLMASEKLNVARQDERVQLTFTHMLSKCVITLKGDRSLNINHEGWRDGATEEQQRAAQIEANSRLVGANVALMTILPTTTIKSPKVLGTTSGTAINVDMGTIATTTELVDPDDAASAWQMACIIPPQTIAAGTQMFKITMADGGVLYYKPAALCTFTSAHVNTYNITVHAKELTLTGCSIDGWTTGDTDQEHESQPVITF